MEETENVRLDKSVPEAMVLYPQEVADIMKCSRWTIYELVKRNKLPSIKIGRGIRIPTKAVLEFIASGGAEILTGGGA